MIDGKACPSEIFLWNFLGYILTPGTLYYLEFLLVYGVVAGRGTPSRA